VLSRTLDAGEQIASPRAFVATVTTRLAIDTVKMTVTHVLGKLAAANRTEVAARARQLGLVP
jgi:hypothetical protein